jgi:hypothetical protein
MKKLILSIILILSCAAVGLAQRYYVISVKGEVYANEKLLKKKDKISADTKIRFATADAFAYVISPGKGYFILGTKVNRGPTKRDFSTYVKNALIPPDQFHATSTRAIPPQALKFRDLDEVKEFFSGEVLLVREAVFGVAAQKLKLDEKHFFTLEVKLPGGETKKLQLSQNQKQFWLSASQFATSKQAQTLEATLRLQNGDAGNNTLLSQFTLNIVPEKAILRELASLRKVAPSTSPLEFYTKHGSQYLEDMYGKFTPEDITPIIQQL